MRPSGVNAMYFFLRNSSVHWSKTQWCDVADHVVRQLKPEAGRGEAEWPDLGVLAVRALRPLLPLLAEEVSDARCASTRTSGSRGRRRRTACPTLSSPETYRWIDSIRLRKPRKNRLPSEPIGVGLKAPGRRRRWPSSPARRSSPRGRRERASPSTAAGYSPRFGSLPNCVSQSTAAQNVVWRSISLSSIWVYTSRQAGVMSPSARAGSWTRKDRSAGSSASAGCCTGPTTCSARPVELQSSGVVAFRQTWRSHPRDRSFSTRLVSGIRGVVNDSWGGSRCYGLSEAGLRGGFARLWLVCTSPSTTERSMRSAFLPMKNKR